MCKNPENPFYRHPDWHNNACISNSLQFWEISDHYMRAAAALVQAAVRDSSLLDVYIYPLIFLYRHAVELFLKDLLWKSHYLVTGEKGFITKRDFRTHDLSKLWRQLKKNCQDGLGVGFPLSSQDIATLEHLFGLIQKHDPTATAFRFPYDGTGNPSHVALSHVNVRSLYESVHQVDILLGDLGAIIMDCYRTKTACRSN